MPRSTHFQKLYVQRLSKAKFTFLVCHSPYLTSRTRQAWFFLFLRRNLVSIHWTIWIETALYKSSTKKNIIVKVGWGHWNYSPIIVVFHTPLEEASPSRIRLSGSKSVPSSRRRRFNLSVKNSCSNRDRRNKICECICFRQVHALCNLWLGFNFQVLFFLVGWSNKSLVRKKIPNREKNWNWERNCVDSPHIFFNVYIWVAVKTSGNSWLLRPSKSNIWDFPFAFSTFGVLGIMRYR